MPQQPLVFEGTSPEDVLRDAWNAHGSNVRLSAPERVREGGVLGFFAKTLYRIQVVPDGASAPAATAAAQSAPTDSASAFESLLDASPDVELEWSSPPVRTFAEALQSAAGSLGEQGRTAPPPPRRPPSAPKAPDPAMPPPVPTERPAVIRPLPSRPEHGEPAPLAASAPIDWDSLLSSLAPRAAEPTAPVEPAAPVSRVGDVLARLEAVRFPTALLIRAGTEITEHSRIEDVFATLPVPRPAPTIPGALVAVVGPPARALRAARALAEESGVPDADVALAIARRPPARRNAKTPLLEGIALEEFAPGQVVESPDDAEALAPGWRRDRVGIVAVAVPSGLASAGETRALLRSLRPSAVYVLADASAKNDDLAGLIEAIGGVDAIWLEGLAETITPADVLALGIPIGRLDGDTATPDRWALVVDEAIRRRSAPSAR